MMDTVLAAVQRFLPQHLISRTVGWIASTHKQPFAKLLIHSFVRLYDIDLTEAEKPNPDAYASFNAFFTRALRSDARIPASDPDLILSPVDGTISQCGGIESGQLLQAKDRRFTVSQLLGGDDDLAVAYEQGRFLTIYLAPHNYHRIHMPLAANLVQMRHVPGRLFSVGPATTRAVHNLFARNERVAFHFTSSFGPVSLIMVGALNVGSIETVHEGVVTSGSRESRQWNYVPALSFERNQELARFNLGSTVIILFANDGPSLAQHLRPGETLKLGEPIAKI